MGKIYQTKRSADSEWMNILYHKTNSDKSYEFRVVDNTDDGLDKKFFVIIFNQSAESDVPGYWQNLNLRAGGTAYFDFFLPVYILTKDGFTQASTYRAYTFDTDGDLSDSGASENPTEFDVVNNSGVDQRFSITKGYNVIEDYVISADSTLSFQYRPTIYIGATNDGSLLAINDFNTELSLLGVASADIVISVTDEVYSFTLSNVVYA